MNEKNRKQLTWGKTTVFLFVFLGLARFAVFADESFQRGVVYYLLGNMEKTAANMQTYFAGRRQPSIESGFRRLQADDKWEATKIFRDVLATNPRSLEALIGFNLAMSDVRDPLAAENLQRALRLNPNYAPAYLCLGVQYLREENYPAAESNLNKALTVSRLAEIKLFLHHLYQEMGNDEKALQSVKDEADAQPGHLEFNMAAARSFLALNKLDESEVHVNAVLAIAPADQEAQLLKGRILLFRDDLRKARSLLEKLVFSRYNLEHKIAITDLYVRLKDKKAEQNLLELFLQYPWNPEVNRLQAVYLDDRRKKNDNRVWIERAFIAGFPMSELASQFPQADNLQEVPSLQFFKASKMAWLNNSLLLVVGQEKSGEKEKLFLVDMAAGKLLRAFEYQGAAVDLHTFPAGERAVLTTFAGNNQVYAYWLEQSRSWQFKPMVGYALRAPSLLAAYSERNNTFYLVDRRLEDAAFESPFSAILPPNRKVPLFGNIPFTAYSFQSGQNRFQEIKNHGQKITVPLNEMIRYQLFENAQKINGDIRKLVQKGESLELTASEVIGTFFSNDNSAFLIYLADFKNAFQALVYERDNNRVYTVDASMFLGKKRFAEIDVLFLDSERQEIVLLSRDDLREVFLFNYSSLVFRKLVTGAHSVIYDEKDRVLYAVCERGQKGVFAESVLEVVYLDPFQHKRMESRKNLDRVIGLSIYGRPFLTSHHGELLVLDEQNELKVQGVSADKSLHVPTPDGRQSAAFINRRLFLLPWIH